MQRFAEDLLPALAPRSSFLLVELLSPPTGCEQARAAVQKESDAVTQGQAATNQNEYVALGHTARRLGLTPEILRPGCEEMKAIETSESPIVTMMETIARLTEEEAKKLIDKAAPEKPWVLLYGGALHNDQNPRSGLRAWSYGPALSQVTDDKYVEIDLVVPELMKTTESWRKFPWYQAAAELPQGHGPVLIETSDRSFALVLPRERGDTSEPPQHSTTNGAETPRAGAP